jgi:dTDP-4-dehydrorhamnose reductase
MNRPRIAVFGSAGQLGSDLIEVLEQRGFDPVPVSHQEADCTNPESIRRAMRAAKPRVAVNCAAFVRVDDCEDRPEEAFRVNALGAFHIARSCAEAGAACVYLSTDYVFDGRKQSAYLESDVARPINVYGASKLAGEWLVRQAAPRWLIVRIASLFGRTGARGKSGNFVETVLRKAKAGERLRVVSDVTMSPTYSRDAAVAIARLLELDATGIVHLTNHGCCSWYEFAQAILETSGVHGQIEPVSAESYPMKATRPGHSCLRSDRLEEMGISARPWQAALTAYLLETGRLPAPQELSPDPNLS